MASAFRRSLTIPLQMPLKARLTNPARAAGAAPWSPLALGAKLLAWWDADRADLMTLAGSQVTGWRDSKNGYEMSQTVSARCPALDITSFNGMRSLRFDGSDDCLEMPLQPFPRFGVFENWGLVSQDSDAAVSTAVRHMFSFGGDTYDTQLRFGRGVTSGANQLRGEVGTGSGASNTSLSSVPAFDGVKAVRLIAASTTLAVGLPPAAMDTPRFISPGLGAIRARLGASSNFTAGNFWLGKIRHMVVTEPLTSQEATTLQTFILSQGAQ